MWSCGGRLWCVRLPCTRRALASCGKSPRAAQMSAGSQTKVGRAECTCDASEAVQMDRYTMGKFPLQPVKRCLHRPRRSVHAASKRCHTAGNQRCGLLKRPERPHRTFDHIWENRSVVPAEIRSTKTETSIAEAKYAFRPWRRAAAADAKEIRRCLNSVRGSADIASRRRASHVAGGETPLDVPAMLVTAQARCPRGRTDCPGCNVESARDTAEWAVEMAERSANGLKFDLILCGSRELVDGMPATACRMA